jgi:hypothetical protein
MCNIFELGLGTITPYGTHYKGRGPDLTNKYQKWLERIAWETDIRLFACSFSEEEKSMFFKYYHKGMMAFKYFTGVSQTVLL